MLALNVIYNVDVLVGLRELSDGSIDMVMTSPPYWGLRDYSVDGQIGLEDHPKEYITKMVEIFRIVKMKLKPSGSLYVNMGDTYCNSARREDPWLQPKQLMLMPARLAIALQEDGWILRNDIIWHKPNPMPSSVKDRLNNTYEHVFHFVKSRKYYYDLDAIRAPHTCCGVTDKRPMGILRQRLYVNSKYNHTGAPKGREYTGRWGNDGKGMAMLEKWNCPRGKNPGDFMQINTQPFPEAHFAVYPEKICERPIKSSCPSEICVECGFVRERIRVPTPEYARLLGRDLIRKNEHPKEEILQKGWSQKKSAPSVSAQYLTKGFTSCSCNKGFRPGIVLDPFAGAGTTCLVAAKLGRNYIGFELNPNYVEIARRRLMRYHSERLMAIVNDAGRRNGRRKPRQMAYARMGA